jgi:hypothetical protein
MPLAAENKMGMMKKKTGCMKRYFPSECRKVERESCRHKFE